MKKLLAIVMLALFLSSCASSYCPYSSSYKSKNTNSCAAYR